LNQSELKQFKIGDNTYFYEPGNQVVYRQNESGAMEKLDLNNIKAVQPGTQAYKTLVGDKPTTTASGATNTGTEAERVVSSSAGIAAPV